MARVNLGILDGFNGKVGNVVGYNNYGRNYMRAYKSNIRNPRTLDQQSVRMRFAEIGKLGRTFLRPIRLGMGALANSTHMTSLNSFVQKNWGNVTGDANAGITIDYTSLKISQGNLPEPGYGTVKYDEALKVEVALVDNSGIEGTDATDLVYIFVYQPDGKSGVLSTAAARSESKVSVALPASWSGMTVYVYGFAIGAGRGNKGLVSDSKFLGSGMIV